MVSLRFMKSPEYRKGYSAGYMARIKGHIAPPTPKPKPDWVLAVPELAERLGREHMAKTCRDLADAHVKKLASDAAQHATSVNEAELLAALHASIEPIIARIEMPNTQGEPQPATGTNHNAGRLK